MPVDLFFSDLPFHESIAQRVRSVEYVGDTTIPVISGEDLILLKTAFNRPKDWVDIESIFKVQGPRLDAGYLRGWLPELFGSDERIQRIEGYITAHVSES